jgi:hypothetical protein
MEEVLEGIILRLQVGVSALPKVAQPCNTNRKIKLQQEIPEFERFKTECPLK